MNQILEMSLVASLLLYITKQTFDMLKVYPKQTVLLTEIVIAIKGLTSTVDTLITKIDCLIEKIDKG